MKKQILMITDSKSHQAEGFNRLCGGRKVMPWLGLLALVGSLSMHVCAREITSLDQDWRFHRGDFSDSVSGVPITGWRWKADARGEAAASEMAAVGLKTTDGWYDARLGDDVFDHKKGFAWFRTVVPGEAARNPVLAFASVDDNAVVYLNGKLLGRHQGWAQGFTLPAGTAWKTSGNNEIAVLVENVDAGGGMGKAAIEGLAKTASLPLTNPINPAYDDASWRKVDVPHDYVVEGTFSQNADKDHGYLPTEPAWYRRSITIPAAVKGERFWLEFDGVFSNSQYWLNGREIGRHRSGYTSFRFDVTDAMQPGKANILTVRVDPVFEGWWYEGGGIYRHVRMITVDPIHIAPDSVFVNAAVPDAADGVHADAKVTVKFSLVNASSAPVDATVLSEVVDSTGKVVTKSQSLEKLAAGGSAEAVGNLSLIKANLWSIENPYLYKLRTQVSMGGRVVDRVSTPFGARQLRFDADHGFFLNGKHVKLKGVCCHQDHAGVGVAIPDRLFNWRLERLKEMGCNAYRCSHNPPAPELLEACDRLGMVVMDETRHLGDTWSGKTPSGTKAVDLVDLTAMVLRDRNHPSIIMWSMCNEEGLQSSPEGGNIFKAMKARTNSLDGTRPVTAAMNSGWTDKGGFSEYVDIQGFNYHPWDYVTFHREHPKLPIFGSETASEVGTRGIYATERWDKDRYTGDQSKSYVSAWGLNAPDWAQTAEQAWRPQAENEFVMGGFAWTGFDYKGEPTPFGWPCINSDFGIMDICGFPKDSYYYYQSWWTEKPVMHVLPHWNWAGKEGQEINVWVYSNCPEVELFLNGTSLGKKEMKPNQHLEWKVKYTPGTLMAKGAYKGKEIVTKVETTGAPAAVVLEPDRIKLNADGVDLSVITVKIVDSKGRVVPTAGNLVKFTVTGAGIVLGVGNGDPTCHEPDKASQRSAFNGLAQVLIQTARKPGSITVKAEAEGLKPTIVTLQTK